MINLYRSQLETMRPYVPGKPIEEVKKEYGIEDIQKLASNENPLGPSPKAIEAVKFELDNINIYPDSLAIKLRTEIANEQGLAYENILVGNGGEQVLSIIAQAFINEDDEAIMASTTFGLYGSSVHHMGGKAVRIPLKNYEHDLNEMYESINEKTKLIYICNPNNPTGNILKSDDVNRFIERIPKDIILILDEAYYDYAKVNPDYPESLDILKKRPNTIILRTFSKVAGIAGVRVGYAMSSKDNVVEMSKVKGVFNVNKLAQAAAMGALKDKTHIERTVELNYNSMKIMTDYFKEAELEYIESNANFIFVNVNRDSKEVFEEMMKKGIIIRPGYLWDWKNWIRVSTGTIPQTEKFIASLREVI